MLYIFNLIINTNLKRVYKSMSSVGRYLMLNLFEFYLGKLFTFLFNRYPFLRIVMGYVSTRLATFYYYLHIIGGELHNKFKNKFPFLYSITFNIYKEYLYIIYGDLSRNMQFIIGLYVLFYYSHFNLILYSLLILNALLKKHFIRDIWLKENFPTLYIILLYIFSLINTIFIFYFLDIIFINIIKPYLLKIWNGILRMASPDKGNIDTGGLADKANKPNPQKPSVTPVTKSDEDRDKKYKEELNRRLELFYKANDEFNSADSNISRDGRSSFKDMFNDYGDYLPETDKKRLMTLLKTEFPKFQLTREDSVHQFWLNKRTSNRPGWEYTLEVIGIYAKNSKSIQKQLGGKNSPRSYLFRQDSELFKMTWSTPYKIKESVIRRELEQSRGLDKLLKEKGLSIKELIDSMAKSIK